MRHPSLSALLLAAATLAFSSLALTACSPEPAPTPTPTGFSSDDEAFRAAEATYRAYVDALNRVDLADPETFEPVYVWLTGEALASTRKTLNQMHENEVRITGHTQARQFALLDASDVKVEIDVCLDVSDVNVLDSSGASLVSESRLERQPLAVGLVRDAESNKLRISASDAHKSAICG